MRSPGGTEPVPHGDRWSAVFLPDGRGAVERGGYGDAPERVLGLRADGGNWVCDSVATRRVLDDVIARGESAEFTHVYEDPFCGPRALEFAFDPLVLDRARIGVTVRCTEITGRWAQARAARLHARMLEAMGEGVLLVSAQGVVRMANPAAEALLAGGGTLVGRNIVAFGARFDSFVRGEHDAAAAGTTAGTTFDLPRPDGSTAGASCTVRALGDDAGTRVVVLRDVTTERRLERELVDGVRRERERIARDLHDGVGQELTAVALLLRGLSEWMKRDRADVSAELDRVVQLVNGVIGGARSMAHGLFDAAMPERELVVALAELARSRNAVVGPAVVFTSSVSTAPALEPRVVTELVRIAQEATANALRHSGASRIDIRLVQERDVLSVVVEDDGRGLSPEPAGGGGMGIGIMQFRARAIGAQFEIGAREGGGTRVACAVRAAG